MTKANNQPNDSKDVEQYKKEMAAMKARMAEMQKQIDSINEKKDHQPKTHLAALPKTAVRTGPKSFNPEDILKSANAKQAAMLKPTSDQKSQQQSATSTAQSSQPMSRTALRKKAQQGDQQRSTEVNNSDQSVADHSPQSSAPTLSQTPQSSVKIRENQSSATIHQPLPSAASENTEQTRERSKAAASDQSVVIDPDMVTADDDDDEEEDPMLAAAIKETPAPEPATEHSETTISEADDYQTPHHLVIDNGVDDSQSEAPTEPAPQVENPGRVYYYFISLIHNNQLVDQGRIITYKPATMNHNGVVMGSDDEPYLDLTYLSKPHQRADALPMPKNYVVDLAEAKTIPDVETTDPSATSPLDNSFQFKGQVVSMPSKRNHDSDGYYLPLTKANGAKIPVRQLSEQDASAASAQSDVPLSTGADHRERHQLAHHGQLKVEVGDNIGRPTPASLVDDANADNQPAQAAGSASETVPAETREEVRQRSEEQQKVRKEQEREERQKQHHERHHEHHEKRRGGFGAAFGAMLGFHHRR